MLAGFEPIALSATAALAATLFGHVAARRFERSRLKRATEPPAMPAAPERTDPVLPILPIAFRTAPAAVQAVIAEKMTSRRKVAPVKAAMILIGFMQDHECTGYYTAAEIDEFWRWCAAEDNIADLHPAVVRERLAESGCCIGCKRLNGPEFIAVKSRTGKERAVLYRIPARGQSVAGSAAGAVASPRKPSGRTSGKSEKASPAGNVRHAGASLGASGRTGSTLAGGRVMAFVEIKPTARTTASRTGVTCSRS